MRTLVEHYKAILNELTSLEDLVKQRGEAGALDQAKRDRERLGRFAASRPTDYASMDDLTKERFGELIRTRLPSIFNRPGGLNHTMEITKDHAGREIPFKLSNDKPSSDKPINAVYGSIVYDNDNPKASSIGKAGIWLPGRSKNADSVRADAHSRLDAIRQEANKRKRERFGPITRPPAPPDA